MLDPSCRAVRNPYRWRHTLSSHHFKNCRSRQRGSVHHLSQAQQPRHFVHRRCSSYVGGTWIMRKRCYAVGAITDVSVGVLGTCGRRAAECRKLVRQALPDAACLQSEASWKHLPAIAVRHFPHARPRTHSASTLSSKSPSRAGKWSLEHGWDECPTTGSLATDDRGAQHGKGGRVHRDHCRADRNASEPDAAPHPVGRHAANVERGNPQLLLRTTLISCR